MLIDRNYEERLYSTGSYELDDLLERAFCDGYEYAQREFGRTGLTAQQAKQFFKSTKGAGKAARKSFERSMAKGTVESLGYKNPNKETINEGIRYIRTKNKQGIFGGVGVDIDGVRGGLSHIPAKHPDLNQRINLKDRFGVSEGTQKITRNKEIMNLVRSPKKVLKEVVTESR